MGRKSELSSVNRPATHHPHWSTHTYIYISIYIQYTHELYVVVLFLYWSHREHLTFIFPQQSLQIYHVYITRVCWCRVRASLSLGFNRTHQSRGLTILGCCHHLILFVHHIVFSTSLCALRLILLKHCLFVVVVLRPMVISGRVPTCDSAHSWWSYSDAPVGHQAATPWPDSPTQSHNLTLIQPVLCPILILPNPN